MQRLNTSLPINKAHPLSRGLRHWWMPPHIGTYAEISSKVIRDLTRRQANGTGSPSGFEPRYSTKSPIGGTGSLYTGAAADKSGLLGTLDITSFNAITISFWMKRHGTNPAYSRALSIFHGTLDGTDEIRILDNGAAGSVIRFDMDDGVTVATTEGQIPGDVLGWHHYMLTHDGSTMSIYVDGKPFATPQSITFDYAGANGETRVGESGNGSADHYRGYYSDIKIFNRTFRDGSALALYRESLAGHPNTLNYSGGSYAVPAVAGGGAPKTIGFGYGQFVA